MVVKARLADIERFVTLDEFELMPEFNAGNELIDGRIVKKPMPGEEHGRIADELLIAIRLFGMQMRFGRAYREITVRVPSDERNGRIPDLCYVVASRRPAGTKRSLEVVPDLVVEVWSPSDIAGKVALASTREKMLYWPNNGVKIIWCINPAAKQVEILYAGQKVPGKVLNINDTLDGEDIIPGFTLPIARLFE